MEILFFPLVLLISVPGGAFVPALLLAWWVRRRWHRLGTTRRVVAGGAVIVWFLYAPYETWMYFWMQSVIAPIRIDLLLIGPILLISGIAGVLACAGRGRKPSAPEADTA